YRGGAVPPLPQSVVRRPAGALPRAGVAGTHVLGARAVPGRSAARPLGRDPPRGAVPARAVRCAVRRLHAAGTSLAVSLRSAMRKDRVMTPSSRVALVTGVGRRRSIG